MTIKLDSMDLTEALLSTHSLPLMLSTPGGRDLGEKETGSEREHCLSGVRAAEL